MKEFPIMMNPMVSGPNIPARTPPERGSFPLDHFQECRKIHDGYLRCLKGNKHDNVACKHQAKEYLQCRMDKNLMAKDSLENLGFKEEAEHSAERTAEVAQREAAHKKGKNQQEDGFVVVKPSLQTAEGWRRASILGGGSWSLGGSKKE